MSNFAMSEIKTADQLKFAINLAKTNLNAASEDTLMSLLNQAQGAGLFTGYESFTNTISWLCRDSEAMRLMECDRLPDPERDRVVEIIQPITTAAMRFHDYQRVAMLFIEYCDALISKKKFPNCINASDNMDYIDALELCRIMYHADKNVESDIREWEHIAKLLVQSYNEFGFLSMIPCFENGVIRIEDSLYAIWKLVKLDLDAQAMDLDITMYAQYPGTPIKRTNDIVIPFLKFSMHVSQADAGFDIDIEMEYDNTVTGMMTAIPPKRMHWNKNERIVWNQTYVKMANIVDTLSDKDSATKGALERAELLVTLFRAVNATLREKKARIPSKPKAKLDSVDAFDPEIHSARKFRTAGIIKFTSERIPRAPTNKTTREYKVASWKVVGFPRRCSSGKVTYVKPQTRYRRCIADAKATTPAPKTIEVKE